MKRKKTVWMITENKALELWDKLNLPQDVREHSKAVETASLQIAKNLMKSQIKVDLQLVKIGALLHDAGRAQDHGLKHGLLGYKVLKKHSLPEEICMIAHNHVGAGIGKKEAVELGLPAEDFIPETLEQKIVSYADNLAAGSEIRDFREVLNEWKEKFEPDSKQVELLQLERAELVDFITVQEMKKAEQDSGLSEEKMMERAGKGIAEVLKEKFDLGGKKIVVFAGPGNNGGDGKIAAKYLKQDGFDIEIADLENLENVQGDLALDALLGTGVSGDIREPIHSAIVKLNQFPIKVAVDVPSGLNPDTGEEAKPTVRPDLVITIHRFKKGLVGKYKLGAVKVIDIGL